MVARAIASGFGLVLAWSISALGNAHEPRVLPHEFGVTSVAFAPDGKTLATVTYAQGWAPLYGLIRLWDTETGKEKATLKIDQVSFHSVGFLDGNTLIACGQEQKLIENLITLRGVVKLWDVSRSKVRDGFIHSTPLGNLAVAPDGKTAVTSAFDIYKEGTAEFALPGITCWDLVTKKPRFTFKDTGGICEGSFAADSLMVAAGRHDQAIKIWDLTTGQIKKTVRAGKVISAVALAPNGKTVAASMGSEVTVWEVSSAQVRASFKHPTGVFSLLFSPDGKILATGTGHKGGLEKPGKGALFLWDTAQGRELAKVETETSIVTIAFSPDGKKLAVGTRNDGALGLPTGTTLLWNVDKLVKNK